MSKLSCEIDWNIPKHLAHFDFEDIQGGGIRIQVYPLLPDSTGHERIKSSTPFFTTTFQPVTYFPSFPASTDWAKYVGWDLGLVQPPLPGGEGAELEGTEEWCKIAAVESSKKTSLGWFDLRQSRDVDERAPLLQGDQVEHEGPGGNKYENFWPGLGRWRIGIKMEDAVIDFPEGEHWDTPS